MLFYGFASSTTADFFGSLAAAIYLVKSHILGVGQCPIVARTIIDSGNLPFTDQVQDPRSKPTFKTGCGLT